VKTHWLFGRGPDKVLDFKREVDEETDCGKCIHREVCDRNTEKRCNNFVFGSSGTKGGCLACSHRFTRYHQDSVPCFSCPWFEEQVQANTSRNAAPLDEVERLRKALTEALCMASNDARDSSRWSQLAALAEGK